MTHIAIIDYGMGNLHSVVKALITVAPSAKIKLVTDVAGIKAADRILLPGQGAMKGCMNNINQLGITEVLKEAAQKKPFLGICVGPQLMGKCSEENGGIEGLGILDYEAIRFRDEMIDQGQPIKIPQMGWNTIKQTVFHDLWKNIPDNSYFYYVHSYHLTNNPLTIGETDYGITYPAAVVKDNIAGLQAHPEKSSHAGLQFLQNFVNWQP